jgi:hypothetical protein
MVGEGILVAEADQLRALMRAAADGQLGLGGLTPDYAEELIAAIRSGRDGR